MHTHEHDESGRIVRTIVESEGQFDARQRELVLALDEYEASLNAYGIPLSEAMSDEANPGNPNGKYWYSPGEPVWDWSEWAIEAEMKKPEYSGDNYARARKFYPRRIER